MLVFKQLFTLFKVCCSIEQLFKHNNVILKIFFFLLVYTFLSFQNTFFVGNT